MSNDYQTLNVPLLPQWATDAAKTLEPSAAQKGAGWTVSRRPPARWLNWLQRLNYGWARAALGGALANWQRVEDATPPIVTPQFLLYHPTPGTGGPGWMTGVGSSVYHGVNGYEWTLSSGSMPANVLDSAIDSARAIFLLQGGAIEYTDTVMDATAFVTVPSGTTGLAGSVFGRIATKWPASDFMIVATDTGTRIKSDGVTGGGAYVTPTSGEPSSTKGLVYAGGTTWFALSWNGGFKRSTDDGVNWTTISTVPGLSSTEPRLARCPDTGRLVVTRPALLPMYSDDGGVTWNTPTNFEACGDGTAHPINVTEIKACGAGAFVMVETLTADALGTFHNWYSVDGGESWRHFYSPVVNGRYLRLGCDGRSIVAVGLNGSNIATMRSGALDSYGLPELDL